MRSSVSTEEIHILLVEDGAPARRLVSIWLESAGYRVTAVPDAKCALMEAGSRSFHAIVVDMGLPDSDGENLVRNLLGGELNRDAAVLAYSGDARSSTRDRALAAGCIAFLEKSADQDELLNALARTLATRAPETKL